MNKTLFTLTITAILLSGCSSTSQLKGTVANRIYTSPDGSFSCPVPYKESDKPKIYDNPGFVSFTSLSSSVIRIDYDNYAANTELVAAIEKKGLAGFLEFELEPYRRLILDRYYGGGQMLHHEAITINGKPMHFATFMIDDPERKHAKTRCGVLIYLEKPHCYHMTVFCRPSHNFIFHDSSEEEHRLFMKGELFKMYQLMNHNPI